MTRSIFLSFIAGFFSGALGRSFFVINNAMALFVFLLGALFLAAYFLGNKKSPLVLFLSFFLIGACLGVSRYNLSNSRENILTFYENTGQKIKISGMVIEGPKIQNKYAKIIFRADSIEDRGESAKILLTVPRYPEFEYGDILTLEGKLEEPENLDGGFDWKGYLAKDNIYFEIFLPRISSREPSSGPYFVGPIKKFLFSLRSKFLDNLSTVLPEPQSSYLAGLTLGDRTDLPSNLKDEFKKVGVIHLVVLSGYNISIVADSILSILRWLSFSVLSRTMITAVGIVLFSIMAGGSATIVRAAIMGLLLLFARETGRVYQALSALIAAAFLMALFNPKLLRFDGSFQLSFLATLSLIIFLPRIEKYFKWITNKFKLREAILSTISTQIFVLPLLIASSGYVSLVSFPANVLILGLVPLTMFFGFITGVAGFLWRPLSQIISWPTYWLAAWQLWVIKFFSKFSFAIFEIRGTSAITVILVYLFLAIFILYMYFRENEQKKI